MRGWVHAISSTESLPQFPPSPPSLAYSRLHTRSMDADGTCLVVSPCNSCRIHKVSGPLRFPRGGETRRDIFRRAAAESAPVVVRRPALRGFEFSTRFERGATLSSGWFGSPGERTVASRAGVQACSDAVGGYSRGRTQILYLALFNRLGRLLGSAV